MNTVTGNTITLDLKDGQFAYYCHLQLQFEIANSLKAMAGEGLPRHRSLSRSVRERLGESDARVAFEGHGDRFRAVNSLDSNLSLLHHLLWIFVIAQPSIFGMSQMICASPLGKIDPNHGFWP
jgi:hypothetical protein